MVEAVENLRLRSAELETSMDEVEVSQFKSLAAALQERVGELEEVTEGHAARDAGLLKFPPVFSLGVPSALPFVDSDVAPWTLRLSRYSLRSHARLPFSHPP